MQLVLANLLLEHAPLEAIVGNRVHWDATPQGQGMPNVVMFVVSGVTDYTMAGASGYVMTRVQIDCRGQSAADSRAIAEAVRDRLSGFSGPYDGFSFQGCFAQGQRTRFDANGYTDSRDYTIHWAPA
jgi:hypothetical protein